MALDKIRAGCLKIQQKHSKGDGDVMNSDFLQRILHWSDQDGDRNINIGEFIDRFGEEIRTEGEIPIENQELEDLFCKLTSGTKENPGTLPIDDLITAIVNSSESVVAVSESVVADHQKYLVIMREMVEELGRFNTHSARILFGFLDKDRDGGVDKDEFVARLSHMTQFQEVTAEQLRSLFSSMLRKGTTELGFFDVYLAICPKLEEQQITKIKEAFTDKAAVRENLSGLAIQLRLLDLLAETEPPKEPAQMAVEFFTCIRFEVPSEAFDEILDHATE